MKVRPFKILAVRSRRSAAATSAGFTLVEVMFAVITLGIGLIMLAAMFPIAINQRKLTGEETNAAAIATEAMAVMTQVATNANMPVTSTSSYTDPIDSSIIRPYPGIVMSLRNPQVSNVLTAGFGSTIFNNVRGNVVLPGDNRLAWIALYRRDGVVGVTATQSNTAQVILIAVQSRNTSTFASGDYLNATGIGSTDIVNLQARPIKVVIDSGVDAANPTLYIATITNSAVGNFTSPPAGATTGVAVQGAYIVIADDKVTTNTDNGRMNARIYKLGAQRTDLGPNSWELAPGNDFTVDQDPDGAGTKTTITNVGVTAGPADAFMVGRSLTSPTTATPPVSFDGPAMDIAVYTGFVPIH